MTTKPVTLKIKPHINISKSFFGKPPGIIVEFGFCKNSMELEEIEKSIITSGY
jgi:hypothetical protein